MLKSLYLASSIFVTLALKAAPVEDSTEIYQAQLDNFVDSVKKAQNYETGLIHLPGGKVELKVPAGFKFLNKEQSKYVLTTLWGNPPENSANTLGMIFPETSDPFRDSSYAFIVEYEEMGYVKDDDAEKIDYDEMLKNLQEDEKTANIERLKQGYSSIHIIGWAQKPFYDKENKVLHWAKEIQFGEEGSNHTLNYEIRILGRHGILSLKAVCTMRELPLVKADINKVLHMGTFTDGNTYFDFDPKIDNVATWTIGGLIAGKVLAKVGFFAVLLKYFAVAWKFILLGFVALAGVFKKFFRRKKEDNGTTENAAIASQYENEATDDDAGEGTLAAAAEQASSAEVDPHAGNNPEEPKPTA